MQSWEQDKAWSDKFLPEIKSILGIFLIGEPKEEEDQLRNTDLMVLKMEAVRIGCRIRTYDYLLKYSDEFTVRAGRLSGIKTELTKIIEGWGDYFFYGFSNKEETELSYWILGDLKEFRIWYMRELIKNNGIPPGVKQNNKDNSSYFYAYKFSEIPNFIIGKKDMLFPAMRAGAG